MSAHSLVARLRNGDPDAVGRLYDEYGRRMFAVALKALGDRSLAEEAVQLTFLKTWQAAERLEPDVEIGGWLYTITRRTAIDLYRRESRHTTVSLDAEIVALPDDVRGSVAGVGGAIDDRPPARRRAGGRRVRCTTSARRCRRRPRSWGCRSVP